jgi:D-glycero-D-manno-heptose 1,7-bisphosphate phosphatase
MPNNYSAMGPGIFIDRDGTLNEEVDFLCRPNDVVLIAGTARAIARLNAKNIPVIIVTNQSGIGRGLFGWEEYGAVSKKIDEILALEGAYIDDSFACPFHEDAFGEYRLPNHPDRKPSPGMILRAAEKHKIDLERSWMIGDKKIDMEAGRRAGCRVALVRTGYGNAVDPKIADIVADNLGQAIEAIIEIIEESHRLGAIAPDNF